MNLNNSTKFLCHHQNGDQVINSEFSGIFNKSLIAENLNLLSDQQETESSSTSTNLSTDLNSEFLQPKRIKQQHSPPKKELNLSDYFKSLQLLQNINEKHLKILKKITNSVPNANTNGSVTMKTSPQNKLENVIFYNTAHSKLVNYKIVSPSSIGLIGEQTTFGQNSNLYDAPMKRKVGRPRNDTKRIEQHSTKSHIGSRDFIGEDEGIINHRTKYGRIINYRLNSDVAKMFQSDPEIIPQQITHEQIQNAIIEPLQVMKNDLLPGLEAPRKQRKISSEFRCCTCKKVYLGKNKMNHHLKLHPDHRAFSNESGLFSHLMKLVRQKKNNQDMANVFFKELSSFVQQCEKFTPKLITNQEHPNVHHHIIDKNAASVLRINPGNYKINMNVFSKNFKFDEPIPQAIEEISANTNEIIERTHHDLEEHETNGHEAIKVVLDDAPSLDGNEVNLLIRSTNELTNLTNISDIITSDAKIEIMHEGDNALLDFLN